jgi:hypothetical protein
MTTFNGPQGPKSGMHAMTHETGTEFVEGYRRNEALLNEAGIDTTEHDACGVGLVAALDGKPSRAVVSAGIAALKAVWHRGAVDADGKTGDGAGIHLEISQEFFEEAVRLGGDTLKPGPIAVGQVFLPKTDFGAQERCRQIVETEILAMGYAIYGWRQVPIDASMIGEKANATRPEIEQILIYDPEQRDRRDHGARPLRHPPAHREAGHRGADPGAVPLLAEQPLHHLQGHVPGRGAERLLPGPPGRALHQPLRHLPPALQHQHLPDLAPRPALPDDRP